MKRWQAALVGGVAGCAIVATLTWAAIAGINTIVLSSTVIAIGAAIAALVLLFVAKKTASTIGVISAFASLVLVVPARWYAYDRMVSDAQDYCRALANGDAGDPPALAQPGYSERYEFEHIRIHSAYRCRFPDPLGGRTHWVGESVGNWTFEHLMD